MLYVSGLATLRTTVLIGLRYRRFLCERDGSRDDCTLRSLVFEQVPYRSWRHDKALTTLVPVSQTSIRTLYVFVEIAIDTPHLALSVRRNFPSSREAFRRTVLAAESGEAGGRVAIALDEDDQKRREETAATEVGDTTRLALVSTIQFVAAIQNLRTDLEQVLPELDKGPEGEDRDGMLAKMRGGDIGVWRGKYDITIPQSRPLSPGEVLGCTAPKLSDVDALMSVVISFDMFQR